MGGKGSGGRRPGTGPKPKDRLLRSIDGGAAKRSGIPTTNADEPPVIGAIEEFDAPDSLTLDERRVWLSLAPHAFKNRTLTRATALSFELLCRNIVLERALSRGDEAGKSDHRGILQRVDAELLRFNLSPNGKPMYDAEPVAKPVNPLERFLHRKRG